MVQTESYSLTQGQVTSIDLNTTLSNFFCRFRVQSQTEGVDLKVLAISQEQLDKDDFNPEQHYKDVKWDEYKGSIDGEIRIVDKNSPTPWVLHVLAVNKDALIVLNKDVIEPPPMPPQQQEQPPPNQPSPPLENNTVSKQNFLQENATVILIFIIIAIGGYYCYTTQMNSSKTTTPKKIQNFETVSIVSSKSSNHSKNSSLNFETPLHISDKFQK